MKAANIHKALFIVISDCVVLTTFSVWLAWLCDSPDPGCVLAWHLMLRLGLIGGFGLLDGASVAVHSRGMGFGWRTGRELIRSSLWRDSSSTHESEIQINYHSILLFFFYYNNIDQYVKNGDI